MAANTNNRPGTKAGDNVKKNAPARGGKPVEKKQFIPVYSARFSSDLSDVPYRVSEPGPDEPRMVAGLDGKQVKVAPPPRRQVFEYRDKRGHKRSPSNLEMMREREYDKYYAREMEKYRRYVFKQTHGGMDEQRYNLYTRMHGYDTVDAQGNRVHVPGVYEQRQAAFEAADRKIASGDFSDMRRITRKNWSDMAGETIGGDGFDVKNYAGDIAKLEDWRRNQWFTNDNGNVPFSRYDGGYDTSKIPAGLFTKDGRLDLSKVKTETQLKSLLYMMEADQADVADQFARYNNGAVQDTQGTLKERIFRNAERQNAVDWEYLSSRDRPTAGMTPGQVSAAAGAERKLEAVESAEGLVSSPTVAIPDDSAPDPMVFVPEQQVVPEQSVDDGMAVPRTQDTPVRTPEEAAAAAADEEEAARIAELGGGSFGLGMFRDGYGVPRPADTASASGIEFARSDGRPAFTGPSERQLSVAREASARGVSSRQVEAERASAVIGSVFSPGGRQDPFIADLRNRGALDTAVALGVTAVNPTASAAVLGAGGAAQMTKGAFDAASEHYNGVGDATMGLLGNEDFQAGATKAALSAVGLHYPGTAARAVPRRAVTGETPSLVGLEENVKVNGMNRQLASRVGADDSVLMPSSLQNRRPSPLPEAFGKGYMPVEYTPSDYASIPTGPDGTPVPGYKSVFVPAEGYAPPEGYVRPNGVGDVLPYDGRPAPNGAVTVPPSDLYVSSKNAAANERYLAAQNAGMREAIRRSQLQQAANEYANGTLNRTVAIPVEDAQAVVPGLSASGSGLAGLSSGGARPVVVGPSVPGVPGLPVAEIPPYNVRPVDVAPGSYVQKSIPAPTARPQPANGRSSSRAKPRTGKRRDSPGQQILPGFED